MLTFRRANLFRAVIALIVSFPCAALSAPSSNQEDTVVWHWFSQCSDAKHITIEVTQDSKIIYTSSFPICHVRRGDIMPEPKQRLLSFVLDSKKHRYFGAKKGARLEGNIWEAGGDPDDIILGVSFDTKEQVFLNSIFILYPDKPSQSELAKDLVIKTFPASFQSTSNLALKRDALKRAP
jgi:hypothetical protein